MPTNASPFEIAAGFEDSTVLFMLAGAGIVIALLWTMWAAVSAYKGWAKERVDDNSYTLACMRLLLLLIMFIWIFTPGL